ASPSGLSSGSNLLESHISGFASRIFSFTPGDEFNYRKQIERMMITARPNLCLRVPALLLAALALTSCQDRRTADERPFGIPHRIPWTTSRLIGSPEPPLPYTVETTFTNIKWDQPIFIAAEPGTDRLFVIQQGGETNRPSRILELRDDPNADHAETFLAVSNYLVYSFAFHPGYRTNGYIYL